MKPAPSRRAVVVVALAAALGAALGSCGGRGGPEPALEVTPNPIDFGRVPWMETPTRTIVLRNRSSRDLLIKDPKFDCSCFFLAKPLPSVHLAPGRAVEVTIAFATTKGTPGPFKKTLTVVCDDPAFPKVDVPVSGTVTDFRQVSPRDLSLGDVPAAGPAVEKKVEVRGGSGYVARAVDATTHDPALELVRKDVPEGTDVIVRTKPGLKPGAIGAQVRLTLEVYGADGVRHRYDEVVSVRGTVR